MTPRRAFAVLLYVLLFAWLVEAFAYGRGAFSVYLGPVCLIGAVILTAWTALEKRAARP